MRYWRAYRFVFDSPHWLANLSWTSLCLLSSHLIPFIGPMVLSGYQYEVVEALHRQGHDRHHPSFDPNRFTKYLVRGLWPTLIQMLVTLPLNIMGFITAYAILIYVSVTQRRFTDGDVLLAMAIAAVIFAIATLAVSIVLTPLLLRAGLMQEFVAAFSRDFLGDFLRRVGWRTILVQLFLGLTAPFLVIAGILAGCIGLYPAAALISFAQHHLQYQLYELYLERGGTPIPLKHGPDSLAGEEDLLDVEEIEEVEPIAEGPGPDAGSSDAITEKP